MILTQWLPEHVCGSPWSIDAIHNRGEPFRVNPVLHSYWHTAPMVYIVHHRDNISDIDKLSIHRDKPR